VVTTDIAEALVGSGTAGASSVSLTGGDLTIAAETASYSVATAEPSNKGATGSKLGIGASFALNIDESSTLAEVTEGTALTGNTGSVSVGAVSTHFLETEAKAGAQSTGGTAIGGGVAIAIGEHDTHALLGSGTDLQLGGALKVTAAHSDTLNTTSDGEAGGQGVGIGVSVAIGIALDDTSAKLAGSVQDATSASVTASHSLTVDTEAKGSAKGADGGEGKKTSDQ
jgi:hypothetical protein